MREVKQCVSQLEICGYHDKHRILLDKILDKMVNFTIDAKRFEILKEGVSMKNRKLMAAEFDHQLSTHNSFFS